MRGALAIAAAVLLASLRAACAHSEADAYQCESNDWDKRSAACSHIVEGRGESRDDRAKALINRGVAYAAVSAPRNRTAGGRIVPPTRVPVAAADIRIIP